MTRSLGYGDGVGATLAFASCALLGLYAVFADHLMRLDAELGNTPAIARLIFHPGWRYGVAGALLLTTVVAHVRPSRYALPLIGVLGVGIVAVTVFGVWEPIVMLPGRLLSP